MEMDVGILDRDPDESIINYVQRLAVYETRNKLFIIGSNNIETKFRVLQVDRTEAKDLVVIDDKHEYTRQDVQKMIERILTENRKTSTAIRKASAHAILGFVRLLEGYYLILVTKRRKVAQIGHHMIYKIDETSMLYIPNNEGKVSADEKRYLKIFQNVDLSSNFYFSYSYDLTHSLQYNLSPHFRLDIETGDTPWESKFKARDEDVTTNTFLKRNKPNMKFVWNEYLQQDLDLHPEWRMYIIHGFVSQTNISVYGLPIYLTLIARRSKKYAGTRFLKRGANFDGDVANEVETEQIVHDSSVSSFSRGRFTSFIQMRGSVPSHWSQDVSKMVPKPLIMLDISDPHFRTAGCHFNQLFSRYGCPVIVLNLVKNKERRPHETVLRNEFISAVRYLNQFLPPSLAIEHIAYDMAYVNKTKESVVMPELSSIAFQCLKRTGIYKSWSSCVNDIEEGIKTSSGRQFQTGVVRINCVDCLDRTNTAAFAFGKAALGLQLKALGVLADPDLEFDTDTIRMLEEVYEDHGDTIALQYGGSQLVHRIKTYRKIAPLSSHSRDIMQTLSRYYSNTFSDADKQNAINVFLGVYVPFKARSSKLVPDVWELQSDYFLHNKLEQVTVLRNESLSPLTCWWNEKIVSCLPLPSDQVLKGDPSNIVYSVSRMNNRDGADGFFEQYRPYELKTMHETLSFQMLHTGKDFMPIAAPDFSPFKVRGTHVKKRKESVAGQGYKWLDMFGSSQSSPPSEADSDEYGDDSDIRSLRSNSLFPETESCLSSPTTESVTGIQTPTCQRPRTFESLLGRPEEWDEWEKGISVKDEQVYRDYLSFGQKCGQFSEAIQPSNNDMKYEGKFQENYASVSLFDFKEPSAETERLFQDFLKKSRFETNDTSPSKNDLRTIIEYLDSIAI